MANEDEKTAPVIRGVKLWNNIKDSRLFSAIAGGVFAIVGAVILYVSTTGVGATEERSRTFDLLSNREIAAQTLQAQVFDVFVQYVVPSLDENVNDHQKVALLAGLHSNFSEFFDTRSVFEAFAAEVDDPIARHELTRLAKRVARRQAEYIKVHSPESGSGRTFKEVTLNWPPRPEDPFSLAAHTVTLTVVSAPRRNQEIDASNCTMADSELAEEGDLGIDDVSDLVAIKVAFTPENEGTWPFPFGFLQRATSVEEERSFEFDLSYMDTPYMDNLWLRHDDGSHDQLALRLIDITLVQISF